MSASKIRDGLLRTIGKPIPGECQCRGCKMRRDPPSGYQPCGASEIRDHLLHGMNKPTKQP